MTKQVEIFRNIFKFKIILVLLLSPITVKSQFSIGIKGGYNISQINRNPSIRQDYLTGYNGGIVIRYISQPHIGVQLEVNQSQKGWNEFELNYGDEDTTKLFFKRKITYLEFPFVSHFYFGDKNRIFLNIGCFFSYSLSYNNLMSKTRVLNNENDTIGIYEYKKEVYEKYTSNTWDFGVGGGIGFERQFKFGSFALESRFSHGFLNNVLRPQNARRSTDYSQNQTLSFFLSYMYTFRGKSKKTIPE